MNTHTHVRTQCPNPVDRISCGICKKDLPLNRIINHLTLAMRGAVSKYYAVSHVIVLWVMWLHAACHVRRHMCHHTHISQNMEILSCTRKGGGEGRRWRKRRKGRWGVGGGGDREMKWVRVEEGWDGAIITSCRITSFLPALVLYTPSCTNYMRGCGLSLSSSLSLPDCSIGPAQGTLNGSFSFSSLSSYASILLVW